MSEYEVIDSLCKKHGIPITRLESELGFGRGSLGKLKKGGSTSAKRLEQIANYFGEDVSIFYNSGTSEVSIRLDDETVNSDTDAFVTYIENIGWKIKKEDGLNNDSCKYRITVGDLSFNMSEGEFLSIENYVRNTCVDRLLAYASKLLEYQHTTSVEQSEERDDA